ncbi:MAG: SDR family NAD(P)-dependent oxidoreductase, partial [Polyangiaceae bacterium]
MRLRDKVAIVTGAATGIGRAIATEFVREGAAVAVDYVGNSECADQLVQTLRAAGGKAVAIAADVSDEQQVQTLVEETVRTFGRIDILVNNAGIEHEYPFLETPRA